SATLREDIFHHKYDLYSAAVTEAAVGRPEPLAALNTPDFNEGAPAVSPFGDFLYFCSDRPGGQGGFDLYRSRRLRGALLPPENLGPSINTPANELDPALGMGGYALFFSSDRATESDGRAASSRPNSESDSRPHGYAVYHTTSREVFSEVERR